jgi:integrase
MRVALGPVAQSRCSGAFALKEATMSRGAYVIPYEGKRGTVWRIKYADADGQQVMETLGPEREGWTRKKAEAELRERLVRVERRNYRRPLPMTFGEYAETWFSEGAARRGWKPSTVLQYRSVRERLVDHFGPMPLAAIRPRCIAEYIAEQSGEHGASLVGRDVDLLHAIFKTALKEELVESNPAAGAERPKLPRRKWRILEPVEVQRALKAFTDDQARAVFLTLVVTGIRRSELQALRWRDVDLIENVIRIRDSKSEDGIRSIAIPKTLAEELWQHRRRSNFQGDDKRVFCHPERGTVYRAETFETALRAALTDAGIEGRVRAFHDLRHTAITNDAAAGANPVALMTKAGHADMTTTKTYMHMAGVVFRDEADRLEERLLGVESSTHLSESDATEDDLTRITVRSEHPADT